MSVTAEENIVDLLEKTRQKCASCQKCSLCNSRTKSVFSGGIPNHKLMLIGEAPGYWEDMKGEPFVGKAGQLLDKIFASVGLSRQKDVYICNTLKCRPPDNRDPLPQEKAACREYLDIQVGALKPKIILLCGNIAVQSFIEGAKGITKIRGQWFDGHYRKKMMPIFHPSYLLRNDTREKGGPKWLMWQDIQEIKRVYDEIKEF